MQDHLLYAQEAQSLEPSRDSRTASLEPSAPPAVPPAHAMAVRVERPRPRLVHSPLR
jgi:hypothetical protein